jgi:PII-like signaling protein
MESWKKLKIYLAETDHWQRQPLYKVIIEKARQHQLAGATVTRAIEGFGADLQLRTSNILALSDNLPIVIAIVDDEEKIREFYQEIKEIITGKLVILEPVEVLQYDP